MLGLGPVQLVEVLIAGGGAIASLVVLAFKAGQWKRQMNTEHNELKDAHQAVHTDISHLVDEINGHDTSQMENCPVCSDD